MPDNAARARPGHPHDGAARPHPCTGRGGPDAGHPVLTMGRALEQVLGPGAGARDPQANEAAVPWLAGLKLGYRIHLVQELLRLLPPSGLDGRPGPQGIAALIRQPGQPGRPAGRRAAQPAPTAPR